MTEFEFDFESIFSETKNSKSARAVKPENESAQNRIEQKKRTSQRKNRSNITVRSMDPEDRKAYHAAMKVTRGQRKDNAIKSLSANIHVCIDLDFSENNSDREKRSLIIQIRNSYGAIRQSQTPVAFHLASFVDKVIIEGISKQNADQWHIYRHEESVLDVFPLEDIVYMSPDAEHALEAIIPGKVYVIGGIVDRNIKRKITLEKASSYEVPVYRLPVREHFPSCTNTVLNIDSVVKAMCSFATHNDWAAALHNCVPLRKLSADDAAARGAEMGARWRRRKEREEAEAVARSARRAMNVAVDTISSEENAKQEDALLLEAMNIYEGQDKGGGIDWTISAVAATSDIDELDAQSHLRRVDKQIDKDVEYVGDHN